MSDHELKQSGEKQTFKTGAQRDTQEGKSRPDLISPIFLDRLGILLDKGAAHYGERNWEKGMPLSRFLASAFRHLLAVMDGQEDEDHAIQCAFNLMAFVHTEHCIRTGSLPIELDDVPREQNLLKKTLESPLTSTKNLATVQCSRCERQVPRETVTRDKICIWCQEIIMNEYKASLEGFKI